MAFQTALVGRNSALSGRGSSTTLSVAFFMPVRTALSLLPRFGPVGLFRVGMGIGPVPAPAVPVAAADGLLLIECLLRFGRQALELCLQGKGLRLLPWRWWRGRWRAFSFSRSTSASKARSARSAFRPRSPRRRRLGAWSGWAWVGVPCSARNSSKAAARAACSRRYWSSGDSVTFRSLASSSLGGCT